MNYLHVGSPCLIDRSMTGEEDPVRAQIVIAVKEISRERLISNEGNTSFKKEKKQ